MASGWLVCVEIEAGRGELEPLVLIVAEADGQKAIALAKLAPEVARPRFVLGDNSPQVHKISFVHPVDGRTIAKLGLAPGAIWNVDKVSERGAPFEN